MHEELEIFSRKGAARIEWGYLVIANEQVALPSRNPTKQMIFPILRHCGDRCHKSPLGSETHIAKSTNAWIEKLVRNVTKHSKNRFRLMET